MSALRLGAAAVLLAGPTALAFFTGGFTDGARAWAGLVAWVLAVVGLLVGGVPDGRPARLALGVLLGLAAWTLLSAAWAPVAGTAWDYGQTTVLYAGALVAAATLLRDPRAARATVPMLAVGTLIVVGYGLAERLLPGLLSFARSATAEGRLEQPLTYWNGMGVVAATGVVLCAGLAADATRPAVLRGAAAAAAVPLGLGLGLTVSRGALWACVAGLLTLLVVARSRDAVRSTALVVVGGVLATLAAQPLHGVTSLAGPAGTRATQGVFMLLVVAVLATVAGIAGWASATRPPRGPLRVPRGAGVVVLLVVVAGFVVAVALGSDESSGRGLGAGAGRLGTLESNRYEYWRVARRAFADEPLRGVGAGGWSVRWRAERPFAENARDAHSLPIQAGAELGLVGLLLLGAWLAGGMLAARRALRLDRAAAAVPVAGGVVWLAHTTLDWDFELPATTLPALVLLGLLLAQSASAMRGASRRNTTAASTQIAT